MKKVRFLTTGGIHFGPKSAILTIAGIVLSGCDGRAAHKMDNSFDCAVIDHAFSANENAWQIWATIKAWSQAQRENTVLGAAGQASLFPDLLFIAPQSSEKVEIDGLRNRNKALKNIAHTKIAFL